MVFVMAIPERRARGRATGPLRRNMWRHNIFLFGIIIQLWVCSLRIESHFLAGSLDFHKLISDHVPATDQRGWAESPLCNGKAMLFKWEYFN